MKRLLFKLLALCLAICSMLTIFVGCGGNGDYNGYETMTFGMYPQTKVLDTAIINQLKTKAGHVSTWEDYGYYQNGNNSGCMYYKDVVLSGQTYRGVYIKFHRAYNWYDFDNGVYFQGIAKNSWQDQLGYLSTKTYWFKYEPIEWSIVKTENGYATLVSEKILDAQSYQNIYYTENRATTPCYVAENSNVYANNYEQSSIRTWLNQDFVDLAFSPVEALKIQFVNVDNGVASTGYETNDYASVNTLDRVFLLSYEEVNAYFATEDVRDRKTTDYAQSNNAFTYLSGDLQGRGVWWLRSPSKDLSYEARAITTEGKFDVNDISSTHYGVVPAIKIKLA